MKYLIATTVLIIVAINLSGPLDVKQVNQIDNLITQGIGK